MATGNDCPACGENIGVWAVFKAPVPNRIRCPHCGVRLRYGRTGGLVTAAVALTVALAAGAIAVFDSLGAGEPFRAVPAAVGTFVAGGAVLEVAFVLELWYGKYHLEPVGKPVPYDPDADF